MNSRAKGKRGELEACKALQEALRCPVERTAQYSGKNGTADIKVPDLPLLHVENKLRGDPITPAQGITFLQQASNDSLVVPSSIPIVVFRWDRMTRFAMCLWVDEWEALHRMMARHEPWQR